MVSNFEWTFCTIEHLINIKKATIQTGPFGTVLSANEFVDYGIPIISVGEIREGYISLSTDTPAVTEETYQKLKKYALSAGDLVLARKGDVDRVAIIPEGKFFLGSDGIRLRFDTNYVFPQLMLYLLQTPDVKSHLRQNSYGTTMAGLNEKIIFSVPINFPSNILEQREIVNTLSDVDALISSLEKLIAKKKAVKQGAMQELLTGKHRLYCYSREWTWTKAAAFGRYVGGGTPSTQISTWWQGKIPWVSSSDISETSINKISLSRFITRDAIESSATILCPSNTILVVSRVGIGKVALSSEPVCTSQDFTNIIPGDEYNPLYIAYLLSFIMKKKAAQAQGTSIKGIPSEDIAMMDVCVPGYEEQSAISAVLSNMDGEIDVLEQKLAKYRQIKLGMMQELLTGQIRLVEGAYK